MLYRLRAKPQEGSVVDPIRVVNKTSLYNGNVEVPMFETPFFAAGAGPQACVSGRFTGAVAPAGIFANNFIYRPDITVLNVTPNKMPVMNADGQEICLTPYFACGFDTPGHIETAYSQRAPFGANFNYPTLSAITTTPNPGADGGQGAQELMLLEGGANLLVGVVYDRGILNGWNIIAYDPLTPHNFHFVQGPEFGGSGANWVQPSFMTARYPTAAGGVITNRTDPNNYWMGGALPTGMQQISIVSWGNLPQADMLGTCRLMSWDDPDLNAQLANPAIHAGPPTCTRATRAGFLMPGLLPIAGKTPPNQAAEIILQSMDGGFYKRLILVAQTPRASTFIANATNGFAMHIDNSGIVYAFDYNDNGRMYTSFGLDIPLTAPQILPLQFAPLPCFSPCYPFFLTPAV